MDTGLVLLPKDAVINKGGHPVTTSLKVAETFGKRHTEVHRAIRELEMDEEFGQRNFASASYLDAQNKARPLVEMTRDGFTLLAMGFTGAKAMKFKLAYIKAFNQMESALASTSSGAVSLPAEITLEQLGGLCARTVMVPMTLGQALALAAGSRAPQKAAVQPRRAAKNDLSSEEKARRLSSAPRMSVQAVAYIVGVHASTVRWRIQEGIYRAETHGPRKTVVLTDSVIEALQER